MSEQVTNLYFVELESNKYSVPNGSLGMVIPIRDTLKEDLENSNNSLVAVRWADPPSGPGGGSAPVMASDLQVLGHFWVPLAIVESQTPHAELEETLTKVSRRIGELNDTMANLKERFNG